MTGAPRALLQTNTECLKERESSSAKASVNPVFQSKLPPQTVTDVEALEYADINFAVYVAFVSKICKTN